VCFREIQQSVESAIQGEKRERERTESEGERKRNKRKREFFVACRGGEDITVAKKKERKKKKKDFKRTLFLSLPCAFCSVLV
jgi:hypothetical protein